MGQKAWISVLGVLFAFSMAAAQQKGGSNDVVRVKPGGAVIYKAELSEEADKIAEAQAGVEVQLLKQGKARSLVVVGGNRGWVDNSTLERIKGGGTSRNLKDIEVQGWLDNPSAVYILDNSNAGAVALPLDRSFAADISDKRDREDVERAYDENK